jgi:hypothetical protein
VAFFASPPLVALTLAKKPNYDFEKRKKELDKKAKQEEKRRRKQENAERRSEEGGEGALEGAGEVEVDGTAHHDGSHATPE